MLWTVFKIFMLVWMLQMVLHFGGSALPVVLVISLAALLLRVILRRPSLISRRRYDLTKTGKFIATLVDHFAGDSKINSSFHNRIFRI